MEIAQSKKGEVCVLELKGRLDSATSPQLEKKILSLLDEGEKFYLLDLAGLDYISSAGLRILLMSAKRSGAAGGKVVLSRLQEHVREVFDIAGFSTIFSIYATPEEGLGGF